jgi:hypothetical protein
MPGLIRMNMSGRLNLLLYRLICWGEHTAHSPLCFTDGSATKLKSKMLFELSLDLADALMELSTLQRNIAEQIGPHLCVTDRLGQFGLSGGNAMGASRTK